MSVETGGGAHIHEFLIENMVIVPTDTTISSTFVDLYDSNVPGLFFGWLLTLKNLTSRDWLIELIIDGVTVHSFNPKKFKDANVFDLVEGLDYLGMVFQKDNIQFRPPRPVDVSSNLKIRARIVSGSDADFVIGFVMRAR